MSEELVHRLEGPWHGLKSVIEIAPTRILRHRLVEAMHCVVEERTHACQLAQALMTEYILSQLQRHGDGCVMETPDRIVPSWDGAACVRFYVRDKEIWSWRSDVFLRTANEWYRSHLGALRQRPLRTTCGSATSSG